MPKHETLAAALAAFQAELPRLRKDETAKVKGESANGQPVNYSYGYADLAQVVEAVSVCLGQHGLAFTAFPTMADSGAFILAYSLLHEGGEERKGVWPLPDPSRVKPQALGSAITYARRYAQMAVTNTFPDKEDDDGAAATPTSHDEWSNARPARPVSAPPAPPAPPAPEKDWSKATDAEVAEQHTKLWTLDAGKAARLYDWLADSKRNLHERLVVSKPGVVAMTATQVLATRLAVDVLNPASTLDDIDAAKTIASDRGLLKVQVSETETLDQVIFEAHELAAHAAETLSTVPTDGPPEPAAAV
jgi:hypothetical protein